MVYNMAMEAGAMLTLGAYAEDWMLAQWWAMDEEERMAVWEEKHGDKEGKKGDMEGMLLRKALRF